MTRHIHILGEPEQRLFDRLDLGSASLTTTADNSDLSICGRILWAAADTIDTLAGLEQAASQCGRRVMVFIVNDFEGQYPLFPHLLLARTSLRASLRRCNETVLPYVWEGEPTPFSPFPLRPGEMPVVSFCGLVTEARMRLLELFESDPYCRTNFICRDKFWGGSPGNRALIEDFRHSIRTSHFVISERGAGNFSMRFYQVLASGRIPVLTDSDLCLPFEHLIDWPSLIAISPSAAELPTIVRSIWQRGRVEEQQQACGRLAVNYFQKLSLDRMVEAFDLARRLPRRPNPYRTPLLSGKDPGR